jgi:hypothetical protein
LYKQWIRDRETLGKTDNCADANGGDYIGNLEKFLSRVNWEGVVARGNRSCAIGFKQINNGGNVNLFLL